MTRRSAYRTICFFATIPWNPLTFTNCPCQYEFAAAVLATFQSYRAEKQPGSSPPVQRDTGNVQRRDARNGTKEFRSTGKPLAGCSVQICVRRGGGDPAPMARRPGPQAQPPAARGSFCAPRTRPPRVECFLLKPKEEATKGTKKKQSKLKNLHRRSGSENFLTKTEMDSRYFFFSNQTSSAATAHQWSEGRDGA